MRNKKAIAGVLAVVILVGVFCVHSGFYSVKLYIEDGRGSREVSARGIHFHQGFNPGVKAPADVDVLGLKDMNPGMGLGDTPPRQGPGSRLNWRPKQPNEQQAKTDDTRTNQEPDEENGTNGGRRNLSKQPMAVRPPTPLVMKGVIEGEPSKGNLNGNHNGNRNDNLNGNHNGNRNGNRVIQTNLEGSNHGIKIDMPDAPTTRKHVDVVYNKVLNIKGKHSEVDPTAGKSNAEKRAAVKEMMTFAWNKYVEFAWGYNELAPLTRRPIGGPFGGVNMGLTIVDSLDTLYLMGMKPEYEKGRAWCAKNLKNALNVNVFVSVFEFNIRVVGGLLSMYALTKDQLYKDLAVVAANKLMPAFETRTGIPLARVNLATGGVQNYNWAAGSILSELGSLHLEFVYLSHITGNNRYRDKVLKVRRAVKAAPRTRGLYGNSISPVTGQFSADYHVAMGALGDSFYEYLLKAYLQNSKDTEGRDMYFLALNAMRENRILTETPGEGLTYFADYRGGQTYPRMEHLACFSGGLLSLGAGVSDNKEGWMNMGKEVTKTCHESYIRSATRLGPEVFGFQAGREAKSRGQDTPVYMLRPEVVESYFVLYRLTKDPKYQDWAWDAATAINKTCRVANGFSGLSSVYSATPHHDDHQQSFFMAETLKYLYLIFSDGDIPLKDWVFNTEAHPLPVIRH